MLTFEEVIGTVEVADRSVSLYHIVAVDEKMLHICIEVVTENIQMTEKSCAA